MGAEAKLISVGRFLCASFLLLYRRFQSKFTQAAKLTVVQGRRGSAGPL